MFRLGAAILSHHVDTFTLVSAFFLFSLGCVNILVGLIWREKGKSRRSITAWKERAKDVLPTRAVDGLEKGIEFGRNVFAQHTRNDSVSSTAKSGLGFGRQGEKAAALKGLLLLSLRFRFHGSCFIQVSPSASPSQHSRNTLHRQKLMMHSDIDFC